MRVVDDVASDISQALRRRQPFDAPRILDDSFGSRAQFRVALHALRHDDARLIRDPCEPVRRERQARLEPGAYTRPLSHFSA